jgi:AraC-like DNA-binding protein
MTQCGSVTFTNPDDYQAAIGISGASFTLLLTGSTAFKARLTWLQLRHLHLLSARESVPRIACVTLPPARAFVSLPVSANAALIWGGVELRSGDIVFHSRGERIHQWTKGRSKWGLISLPHRQLALYGKALTGLDLAAPQIGQVIRLPPSVVARLLDLHSSASRLAEAKPEVVAEEGAAQGLEQEFIHALVNCLTADDAYGNHFVKRHQADILLRLEDAMTDNPGRRPSTADLSVELGVTERTLRACCAELLGISPGRYLRLRRLNMKRAIRRRVDLTTSPVAKIAHG